MMRSYARIDSGHVAELFETDGDISSLFNPAMQWVDVTTVEPAPGVGWSYDGQDFTAKALPPTVTLTELKAGFCVAIDAAADAAYIAIGGPSPGRLAEYRQANDDAIAFKAANYSGDVPPTIGCWMQATGWTAQQACDDVLATAAAWNTALVFIRSARLLGKSSVNAAPTAAAAKDAADTATANIHGVLTGL